VHRNYAQFAKRNEASGFGAVSAGSDFHESDEAAKIELTYSTMASISRVAPALDTLIVCIIQFNVPSFDILLDDTPFFSNAPPVAASGRIVSGGAV